MRWTCVLLAVLWSAAAAAEGVGRRQAEEVPALPGDTDTPSGTHQTSPSQEDVIPQTGSGVTAPTLPDGAQSPGFHEDVVPRSRPEERRYHGDATEGVQPDVIPDMPYHELPLMPDERLPEDVLPAPDDDFEGRYDPLETRLDGGTKPPPKQPEGTRGVPAGGYRGPL